jgi:hypothetical protein
MRDTALQNDALGKFMKEDSASREILTTVGQCRLKPAETQVESELVS